VNLAMMTARAVESLLTSVPVVMEQPTCIRENVPGVAMTVLTSLYKMFSRLAKIRSLIEYARIVMNHVKIAKEIHKTAPSARKEHTLCTQQLAPDNVLPPVPMVSTPTESTKHAINAILTYVQLAR